MKKNIIHIIAALLCIPLFVSAQSQTYTAAQVAQHNTTSDCWIIISGNVYSVGSYISIHPGGKKALTNQCGKDATTAFNTQGGKGSHSSSAHATLNTFLIGTLALGATPTIQAPSVATPTPSTNQAVAATTSGQLLTINQTYTLCTQTAIRKRDTALIAARSTYNASMTQALDARTIAETNAVAIADDSTRQATLVSAATAYGNQVKTAQDVLKKSRQNILASYDADIKKCKSDKQTATTNSNSSKKRSTSVKNRNSDTREKLSEIGASL
jgi:cytochrome b involved in lipid metabolism